MMKTMKALMILVLLFSLPAAAAEPKSKLLQAFNYLVFPTSAHVPVPTDAPNLAEATRKDAAIAPDMRGVVKLNVTRKLSVRFGGKAEMNEFLENARETRLARLDLNADVARNFIASRMEVGYQIRF